ncbi:MAG: hypothetical protein CMQ48_02865 [Gammaproteobacteria bacterium]|nr:hypothetical protein [Gammaproteobacteria bacterium]
MQCFLIYLSALGRVIQRKDHNFNTKEIKIRSKFEKYTLLVVLFTRKRRLATEFQKQTQLCKYFKIGFASPVI